jgi:hypothetical protein
VLIQSIEEADQRERTYEGAPAAAPEQFRPTGIFSDPDIDAKLNTALSRSQKAIIIGICETMIRYTSVSDNEKLAEARGMLEEFNEVAEIRVDAIIPKLNKDTVMQIARLLDFSPAGVYGIYNQVIRAEQRRRGGKRITKKNLKNKNKKH